MIITNVLGFAPNIPIAASGDVTADFTVEGVDLGAGEAVAVAVVSCISVGDGEVAITVDIAERVKIVAFLADDPDYFQSAVFDLSDGNIALQSASTADPLENVVPGSYAEGTAGYNLGKLNIPGNPDAPIVPIPVNTDPDTQTIYFPDTAAGRSIDAFPIAGQIIEKVLVDREKRDGTTEAGSPGAFLRLIRGIKYRVSIGGWGEMTITVTGDSERQFADYLIDGSSNPPTEGLTIVDGGVE